MSDKLKAGEKPTDNATSKHTFDDGSVAEQDSKGRGKLVEPPSTDGFGGGQNEYKIAAPAQSVNRFETSDNGDGPADTNTSETAKAEREAKNPGDNDSHA